MKGGGIGGGKGVEGGKEKEQEKVGGFNCQHHTVYRCILN